MGKIISQPHVAKLSRSLGMRDRIALAMMLRFENSRYTEATWERNGLIRSIYKSRATEAIIELADNPTMAVIDAIMNGGWCDSRSEARDLIRTITRAIYENQPDEETG